MAMGRAEQIVQDLIAATNIPLALVPCDAGSMLMHADNGSVDHLDSGIMEQRQARL
jgi:hypothetical protein